jgi:predicted DNA-binding transcriptional regulator AlpA
MTSTRMLRLPDVAERTGLTVRTLRNLSWRQRRGLPTGHAPLNFRHVGRLLIILESDVESWLEAEQNLAAEGTHGPVPTRRGHLQAVPDGSAG